MGYDGVWGEIPVGTKGLMTDMPSSELPKEALIRAENIDFTPGYIEKAPGAFRYNSNYPLSSGLVCLQDYWLSGSIQRTIVMTADGKVWKDTGDATFLQGSPILTGLGNIDNRSQIIIGGQETANAPRKVFILTNGQNQIQVISGDNNFGAPIALPSTDWQTPTSTGSSNVSSFYPTCGVIFASSLWVFRGSQYYASNTTNHEDFQTLSSILTGVVGPGEGGNINGVIVFRGQMLVFKEGGYVYQLNTTSTQTSQWYFQKWAEGFSIANVHANPQVLNDMIIANNTNTLTSYSATLNFGDFSQADIFKTNLVSKYYREYTSVQGVPYQQGTFYPLRGQAYFTGRTGMFPYNDIMTVLDVSQQGNPRFCLWNHYQADCIGMRRDINSVLRPMYGGQDGYLYFQCETRAISTSGTQLTGGTGYLANFKTPYVDFRYLNATYGAEFSEKQKQFELLGVTFTPDGNHNLSVDVWIDGKFSETVTVNQTIDTNYLGAFKLGTSILGVEEEQTIFVPIHGAGRRISLRCYNGNAYESFRVSKLGIGFRLLGEDQTRLAAP